MTVHITYFVHGIAAKEGNLSPLAERLLFDLGAVLKHKKLSFDAVFCSDLDIAFNSAKCLFNDQEPMRDKRLIDVKDYVQARAEVKEFLNELLENYDGKRVAVVAYKTPRLALEVIINNKSLDQAIEKTETMKLFWNYELENI